MTLRRLLILGVIPLAVLPGVRAYTCASDISYAAPNSASKKGLAVDDTTLRLCASRIPTAWPNTDEPVTSLRLFKAWSSEWPESTREAAWDSLTKFVKSTNSKVLVGTQITCESDKDDQDWVWTKQLISKLSASTIMGVAIGNELDILADKESVDDSVTTACVTALWSGGFWATFQRRVADLDAMGLAHVPITTVFTGKALGGSPFLDVPDAKVNTFLTAASHKYGSRFAFTFNFYPYFDPNYVMDAGTTNQCSQALSSAACFTGSCQVPRSIVVARQKIQQVSGSSKSLFWVGETGWSFPAAQSLHTKMKWCDDWSSESTFRHYYEGFLGWTIDSGVAAPDHVFYFDVRDSLQYNVPESFGLIESCRAAECKIKSANFSAPDEFMPKDLPTLSWYSGVWWALGGTFLVALIIVFVAVRLRKSRERLRARLAANRESEVATAP